ncbi:hypothetical protein C2845_PM01G42310 [Panicum miliaceum]|uniref:Uncharacterized protein n=1 Tax=Panicum miliaceum TaxID=4540 RepID=A0A3L6TL86_PANMI|nr:hypothetical protein C2845_PM01G42310 [Panicum miliaceum]
MKGIGKKVMGTLKKATGSKSGRSHGGSSSRQSSNHVPSPMRDSEETETWQQETQE